MLDMVRKFESLGQISGRPDPFPLGIPYIHQSSKCRLLHHDFEYLRSHRLRHGQQGCANYDSSMVVSFLQPQYQNEVLVVILPVRYPHN